jgi:tRNA(Ile)-lysidine synthetase-like protein
MTPASPTIPALAAKLENLLAPEFKKMMVAVSGGGDSMFLLALASYLSISRQIPLRAVMVNYQLRDNSSIAEENLVREYCQAKNIPLAVLQLKLGEFPAGNLQNEARKIRMEFFLEQKDDNEAILLGQQAWDQSESLMLAIMRKKLPWGACGLYARRDFWIRPLLSLGRDTIRKLNKKYNIPYLDDPSNSQSKYERNWIRHQVMAGLRLGMPDVDLCMAEICAEFQLLRSQASKMERNLWENLDFRKERGGHSLARQSFLKYHVIIGVQVLRELGFNLEIWERPPAEHILEDLREFILNGRNGAFKPLTKDFEICLSSQRFWIYNNLFEVVDFSLKTDSEFALRGYNFSRKSSDSLNAEDSPELANGYKPDIKDATKPMFFRTWKAGDRFRISFCQHKLVSDLLSEKGLSRLEKSAQLVAGFDNEIKWIPGLRRAWRPENTKTSGMIRMDRIDA